MWLFEFTWVTKPQFTFPWFFSGFLNLQLPAVNLEIVACWDVCSLPEISSIISGYNMKQSINQVWKNPNHQSTVPSPTHCCCLSFPPLTCVQAPARSWCPRDLNSGPCEEKQALAPLPVSVYDGSGISRHKVTPILPLDQPQYSRPWHRCARLASRRLYPSSHLWSAALRLLHWFDGTKPRSVSYSSRALWPHFCSHRK